MQVITCCKCTPFSGELAEVEEEAAEAEEAEAGSVPALRHLTTPAGFRSHYGGNDRRVSDTRGSGGGSPIHQP